MNETIDLMHRHRSIRKYKDKPVEPEKLDAVLEAAHRASSSGNMQAYSIIVTRCPELKQRLHKAHFEQDMVLEAPLFLTFCADFHRMKKWLSLNEAPQNFDNLMSFMIAGIDAILASQNAALAAESLDLGICYLGTTLANSGEIGRILNCPENVVPVVGFPLGYPDEEVEVRDRLPLNSLVHTETYQAPCQEVIEDTYRERNHTGMKRYRARMGKQIKASKINNLAQVYTRLKYTRESHVDYSTNLLGYLTQQNFFNHDLEESE